MNPNPPSIKGLIKIHKTGAPIHPIINWQQAPAYSLAKLLSERIGRDLHLPFRFNIKNSMQLMSELREITPYTQKLCMAALDIVNTYTHIPTSEVPKVTDTICNYHNIPQQQKQELLYLIKVILKQNYFTLQRHTYTQQEGLAMGAPTSARLSQVLHMFIYGILKQNNIQGYFRYVDSCLIIYDTELTDVHSVLSQFNTITPNLKFTIEEEKDKCINFLDVTVIREQQQFSSILQ
jgi:hypothetical protein